MLKLSDVSVTFQDAMGKPFKALEIASVEFEPGHITVVSGPSGSGKSTLLHVIAGLLPPTNGDVTWQEKSVSKLPETQRDRWRRETIGYLFQDFQLDPGIDAAWQCRVARHLWPQPHPKGQGGASAHSVWRSAIAVKHRRVVTRRTAACRFARALFFDPPVILADEPTASLDQANGEIVIEHLLKLASQGKTVITASHDAGAYCQGKATPAA